MNTSILQLVLVLRTIKWPVMTAALAWLIAMILGGYLYWEQQALRDQTERVAALRGRLLAQSTAPNAPPLSATLSAEHAFDARLGDNAQLEQYLRTLFEIAGKQNINLAQGNYKVLHSSVGNHAVYTIDLPINGNYGKIKIISEQLLLALPFSALEEIKFKRENVGQAALETQLKFALFLKPFAQPLDSNEKSGLRTENKAEQKPGGQL